MIEEVAELSELNLETFYHHYSIFKEKVPTSANIASFPAVDLLFRSMVDQLGGKSYQQGILVVFDNEEVARSTLTIWEMFPRLKDQATVFGCDWKGRYFATRQADGEEVILIEPDTDSIYEIEVGLAEFYNSELVQHHDAALASTFFQEWKENTPEELLLHQCVGYRVPLFLGGEDVVDNLEIVERQFYAEFCGQLLKKVRNLPEGTPVSDIRMEE